MIVSLLQETLVSSQSLLLAILREALLSFQSLPSYIHLCIVTTLERLLVLLSLVLNAYVCLLFVKTWRWPQKQKTLDEGHVLTIDRFIDDHSQVSEDVGIGN